MYNLNGVNILNKAMDAYWARNNAITKNIANSETPNYKRKTVEFENMLKEALNSDSQFEMGKKSIESNDRVNLEELRYKIKEDLQTKTRLDGNNVDIDVEMAKLTQNTIRYNTATQQTGVYFRRMKNVIKGGR